MKTFAKWTAAAAVALGTASAVYAEGHGASMNVPNLSYRTGPFAATGIPIMNGQADYFAMLNARDGGIGGAMIDYEECETGYSTEKGVECYEATKADAIVTQPWSTGITLQVLPKTNVDEMPLLAPGYGFSPMADGEVFQWAFNMPGSYWDAASMILQEISGGDLSSLSGQKIVLLHLDHPYGKEPIPFYEAMAAEHGFEFLPIPVGLSEMQNQSAQWLQIRRERPDYVIMWGWGAMNAGALTEAIKTRYPMDQFIGVWWSGHNGDLEALGEDAAGYRAISYNAPNPDAPVLAAIREHVSDSQAGEGEMDWVFYQRGLVISMLLAEGITAAQAEYDTAVVSPQQLRWGLENINLTQERIDELGFTGMIAPFSTSCADHTGHSGGWMIRWDGATFQVDSDHLMADQSAIAPLVEAAAAEYAEANAPWPTQECDG